MIKKLGAILFIAILAGVLGWNYVALPVSRDWTATETALIQSLSLSLLPLLPTDPSNSYADIDAVAEFGHHIFFDNRFSSNGRVSCATCHQPELYFTDGMQLAVGAAIGTRNTPTLVGVSHSPWFYWDGRKDSQWAQALAPIEAAHEQNISRTAVLQLIASDSYYRSNYEALFGLLPPVEDMPAQGSPQGDSQQLESWQRLSAEQQFKVTKFLSNIGKALAAYQRKLIPGRSRFDAYADSLSPDISTTSSVLNGTEIAGLRLFIGKAQCINCHNGPLFTNHEFHNTGILSASGQLPSMGRYDGIRIAREDPFNCLGAFSDASPEQCTELRFARDTNDLVGAHKTPTLRNITATAPYMHSGQIATLREVLEHYNEAPVSMLSHNEAKPLGMRTVELRQLETFLETLTTPLATDRRWLLPPAGQ